MTDEEVIIRLGLKIKEFRTKKNLTQEELGEKTGLKRQYVNKVENGNYNVSIVTIKKIAKALEVTLAELLEGIEALN